MNQAPDLTGAVWRKASYSNSQGGNCVEVTKLADGSWMVRDSKNPAGSMLHFTPGEWVAFTAGVKDGEFDR